MESAEEIQWGYLPSLSAPLSLRLGTLGWFSGTCVKERVEIAMIMLLLYLVIFIALQAK